MRLQSQTYRAVACRVYFCVSYQRHKSEAFMSRRPLLVHSAQLLIREIDFFVREIVFLVQAETQNIPEYKTSLKIDPTVKTVEHNARRW